MKKRLNIISGVNSSGRSALLLGWAMLACSESDPAQQTAPLSSERREEAAAALNSALAASVEAGDTPGVVGLVVDRDGTLFEGSAGRRNVAQDTSMTTDTIFAIASMTKPVTSVAIMMLYEQGQLDLDDSVSEFLEGFADLQVLRNVDLQSGQYETAPATATMTLRHLLTHTSGLGYAFANSTVARLQQGTTLNEWELPLLNEPGARWHYSASTRVLGMVVEEVTGRSLEDFFQTEIFQPLGMVDTSFAVPTDKQTRLSSLYARTEDGALQESPPLFPIAAEPTPPFMGDGGLYSTAHDYGLFMRMLLGGGTLGDARILKAESVEAMGTNQIGDLFVEQQEAAIPTLTRPFPLGAGVDKFGLGFQLTTADSGGVTRGVGSMAWAGLFNTEFWVDPASGVAATLLMQTLPFYDEGALRSLESFEKAVYRDLVAAPN